MPSSVSVAVVAGPDFPRVLDSRAAGWASFLLDGRERSRRWEASILDGQVSSVELLPAAPGASYVPAFRVADCGAADPDARVEAVPAPDGRSWIPLRAGLQIPPGLFDEILDLVSREVEERYARAVAAAAAAWAGAW